MSGHFPYPYAYPLMSPYRDDIQQAQKLHADMARRQKSLKENFCTTCTAEAEDVAVQAVGDPLSGCMKCPSLWEAYAQRTDFDKKNIAFYDQLRKGYNTNLLGIETTP